MDIYAPLAPPVASETASSKTSGASKRRRKSALPRCFLIYERVSEIVSGAMLLTECSCIASAPATVYWRCDRVVALATPFRLRADLISWKSRLGKVPAETEAETRDVLTTIGGALKYRMPEAAESSWLSWPAAAD